LHLHVSLSKWQQWVRQWDGTIANKHDYHGSSRIQIDQITTFKLREEIMRSQRHTDEEEERRRRKEEEEGEGELDEQWVSSLPTASWMHLLEETRTVQRNKERKQRNQKSKQKLIAAHSYDTTASIWICSSSMSPREETVASRDIRSPSN
jgi:hypothetical protein